MSVLGTIVIKKTSEDNYILNIPEKHIEDEEVDGPKLLAMLGKERLTDTTADDVLSQFDNSDVETEMRVRFRMS
jgi:hypothetical protein